MHWDPDAARKIAKEIERLKAVSDELKAMSEKAIRESTQIAARVAKLVAKTEEFIYATAKKSASSKS